MTVLLLKEYISISRWVLDIEKPKTTAVAGSSVIRGEVGTGEEWEGDTSLCVCAGGEHHYKLYRWIMHTNCTGYCRGQLHHSEGQVLGSRIDGQIDSKISLSSLLIITS